MKFHVYVALLIISRYVIMKYQQFFFYDKKTDYLKITRANKHTKKSRTRSSSLFDNSNIKILIVNLVRIANRM